MNLNISDKRELLLESRSGFSMPFESDSDNDVQISLGYGEQRHPATGETFFHRGMDFVCPHLPLYGLATGSVIGAGTDAIHENYIVTKYGRYEVKYGHVSEGYVSYGQPVSAGQAIALSGDFLHFEVSYGGQPMDPLDFLGMIYGNIQTLAAMGISGSPARFVNLGTDVRTSYDKDKDELLSLMLRWVPSYFNDLRQGSYAPSERTEASLRNIFAQSAEKNYFFENVPNLSNPLGLGPRGSFLSGRVMDVLIGDFLSWLALRRNTYLSSWGDSEKKTFLSRLSPTGSS